MRKTVKAVGAELLQLSRQQAAAANGRSEASAEQAGRPAAVDPGSFLALIGSSATAGKEVAPGVVHDDAWATNQATTFLVSGSLQPLPAGMIPPAAARGALGAVLDCLLLVPSAALMADASQPAAHARRLRNNGQQPGFQRLPAGARAASLFVSFSFVLLY